MTSVQDYLAFDTEVGYLCGECACEHYGGEAEVLRLLDSGSVGCIHEDTFQFEQYLGEIIPLEGVYCAHCDAECYAPFE
jgi:hypothetical protein